VGTGLGRINMFCSLLKTLFLCKNLDQNMLKMHYFWKKAIKTDSLLNAGLGATSTHFAVSRQFWWTQALGPHQHTLQSFKSTF